MLRSVIGFADKLYWRQISGWQWHCFKKSEGRQYTSLCGELDIISSGGQKIRRPRPELRCSRCDVLEMKRRGWGESGPESPSECRK